MPGRTQVPTPGRPNAFVYGAFTLCGASFHPLRLALDFVTSRSAGRRIRVGPTTPTRQRLPPITSSGFGLFPFRSPLLRESRFLSFPRATKMFQFARLPPRALFDSGTGTRALPRVGFPIRTSRDQRMVSSYPGLFAAAHVLLRLLAPRHPPSALRLLIVKNTVFAAMEFSRYVADRLRATETAASRAVSQNSTALRVRGRRSFQASPNPVMGRIPMSTSRTPTEVRAPVFPRKEVIQPQLPLRLPCYDFTPITNPTFDGSLPCGLGHRLRVLPAFVV